jgi:hypothetical protein
MPVAIATQFITTLIANRFLLAIGPECANYIVFKASLGGGRRRLWRPSRPHLQSKVHRNTSDDVFERIDYNVGDTIEIKPTPSACFRPLKGGVSKFPLPRIIFFCRLKVLKRL